MPRRPLTELFVRSLLERTSNEKKIITQLKKDKKFNALLKKLQQIDDELEAEIDRIVTDPELKDSIAKASKEKDLLHYLRNL